MIGMIIQPYNVSDLAAYWELSRCTTRPGDCHNPLDGHPTAWHGGWPVDRGVFHESVSRIHSNQRLTMIDHHVGILSIFDGQYHEQPTIVVLLDIVGLRFILLVNSLGQLWNQQLHWATATLPALGCQICPANRIRSAMFSEFSSVDPRGTSTGTPRSTGCDFFGLWQMVPECGGGHGPSNLR